MPHHDLQWILEHGKLRLTTPPVLYHCEPIWSWNVDSLPEHALLLTLEGRGQLTVNGAASDLRQGICYFLKPGSKVAAQQNPSYPLFLFLARFDILDTNGKLAALPPGERPFHSVFIRKVRSLETLAELVVSHRTNDPLFQDAINMLIRLLVEEAARHAGDFDSNAYEALHAIENDLARKWTVAALAREAQMPRGAFARSFRRMMNEPPIHYVIRRRMEEAKRQIQQSSLSIEEIAINLGYSDLSYFRKLFLERIGYPVESIRENREF